MLLKPLRWDYQVIGNFQTRVKYLRINQVFRCTREVWYHSCGSTFSPKISADYHHAFLPIFWGSGCHHVRKPQLVVPIGGNWWSTIPWCSNKEHPPVCTNWGTNTVSGRLDPDRGAVGIASAVTALLRFTGVICSLIWLLAVCRLCVLVGENSEHWF